MEINKTPFIDHQMLDIVLKVFNLFESHTSLKPVLWTHLANV